MKFLLEKTPAVSDYELFTKEEYNDGTHKTSSDNVIAFDAEFKTPSGALLFLKNILYAFLGEWSDQYDVLIKTPNMNYIVNAVLLRKAMTVKGAPLHITEANRTFIMLPNLFYELCGCNKDMKYCYEVTDDLFDVSRNIIYLSHPDSNIVFSQNVRKFFWDRPINTQTFDDDIIIYFVRCEDAYMFWKGNNIYGKSYKIGNENIEPNFLKKINGLVPKNVLFDYNKKLSYPYLTLYLGIFPYTDETAVTNYYYTFVLCNNSLTFKSLYEHIKSIYGLEKIPEDFIKAIKKEYKYAK